MGYWIMAPIKAPPPPPYPYTIPGELVEENLIIGRIKGNRLPSFRSTRVWPRPWHGLQWTSFLTFIKADSIEFTALCAD